METITGTNPQTQGDSLEALAARLKTAELNPEAAKAHVVGGKAASEVQEQTQAKPTEAAITPPPAGTKEGLPQTMDKGEVPLSEIQKRNEHLEKGIKEKEELLRRNKELLAKFHQTSQAAAETGKQLGAAKPLPEGGHGQELDKAFLARLAKANDDPLVLRDLIREEARNLLTQEVGPIRSEWEQSKQDRVWSRYGEELVDLAKAGHTWIATEGLERFERVFQEKPYLLQSPTPYMDAMRFIDAPTGPAAVSAQNGKPAPILGGGSAVPPPSSAPAATTEQKMADLSKKFQEAAKWNDRKGMAELMEQMTRLNQGR